MACKYYLNGIPSPLYNDLFGYMDRTPAEKKSSNQVLAPTVHDSIRKSLKIAAQFETGMVLTASRLLVFFLES